MWRIQVQDQVMSLINFAFEQSGNEPDIVEYSVINGCFECLSNPYMKDPGV
ncbi:MAG: hypothetical protein SCALA702_24630 [Melioribacteraceae bacterium]|nr:MAG: hypothetical protein SCALA702_24630 [Melioribacteraceae bacterium]